MKTVDDVLDDVLRREGWPRVTDHPADAGGLTKGGVTIRAYNAYLRNLGRPPLTREKFVELSEPEALDFFLSEYLQPFAFIGDEGLFAFLGDWAVHAGIDDPARALQTELAARGLYTKPIDGDPGPKTREAWEQVAGDAVACRQIKAALVSARIRFHVDRALDREAQEFIRTHPKSQLVFLRGWVNRAVEFVD